MGTSSSSISTGVHGTGTPSTEPGTLSTSSTGLGLKEGDFKLVMKRRYIMLSEEEREKRLKKWERAPEMCKILGSKSKCANCSSMQLKLLYEETDADISGHTAEINYYHCLQCGVLVIENPAFG